MQQRAVITPQNAPYLKRLAQFGVRGQIAWHPEQPLMAVIGKTTRFFDTRSLTELPHQWSWDEQVREVGASRLGNQIAVIFSHDHNIYLYELTTGREQATLHYHDGRNAVKRLVFSPQGNWLVSEAGIHSALWHIPSGDLIGELPCWHKYAFSRDDLKLVGAGYGKVWQMDLRTAKMEVRLHYDVFRVMDLVFSPDNITVAACGDAYAPSLVFDAACNNPDAIVNPELMQMYREWKGGTATMEFHQTLSEFNGAPVRLWNLANGRAITLESAIGTDSWTVAFSPDGTLVAAGAGDSWSARNPLQLWNSQTQEPLALLRDTNQRTAANPPRNLSFSPDGTLLACDGGLSPQIELWGVPTT
jgi:WD40 repeat protein